jgi:hypothetical protein
MYSVGSCVHGPVSCSYIRRVKGQHNARHLLYSVRVTYSTSLKLEPVQQLSVLSPICSHIKQVFAAVWLRIPICFYVTLRRWVIGLLRSVATCCPHLQMTIDPRRIILLLPIDIWRQGHYVASKRLLDLLPFEDKDTTLSPNVFYNL